MKCDNEKCLFNFYRECAKNKDGLLILDKKGKCKCFEKIPKMTYSELKNEVKELAKNNDRITIIEMK
jgi:hypothetical protein